MNHRDQSDSGIAIAVFVLVLLLGSGGVAAFVLKARAQATAAREAAMRSRMMAQKQQMLAEKARDQTQQALAAANDALQLEQQANTEKDIAAEVADVVVHVTETGELSVDGKVVTIDQLREQVFDVQRDSNSVRIEVRAVADCPFKHLAPINQLADDEKRIAVQFVIDETEDKQIAGPTSESK